MGNIRDYIKEQGSYTLEDKPFNDVDNLIMSYLVYYDLTGIVPEGQDSIGIREAAYIYNKQSGTSQKNVVPEFLGEVARSRRFGDIRLSDFRYRLEDNERTIQFTALNIELKENLHYVAFRGIAQEHVGWYEAFKMSYRVIPAQIFSRVYLERILAREENENAVYIVGGHSKGGAQAVYAAAACDPKLKKYISRVYSNDGPAVREEYLSDTERKWLTGHLTKIVPECAVIGMIFEKNNPDMIVKSSAVGISQHEPMSWQADKGRFIRAESLNGEGVKVYRAINKWNDSLKDKEKIAFINEVFGFLRRKPEEEKLNVGKLLLGLGPKGRKATRHLLAAAVSCRINLKPLI